MTREEAIGHIKDVICENNTIKPNIAVSEQEKEALYMAIEALKQEPKTGHWKPTIVRGSESYICSECSAECCYVTTNYCPSCGAEMKEGEKRERN